MQILKVGLIDGQPLSEIKVSRKFVAQSCVWIVEVNGQAYAIRRDDAGSWMQHSRDNLSPELLFRVGQAIESLFIPDGASGSQIP